MKLTIRKKLLGLSFIAVVLPLIVSAVVMYIIVTNRSQDESINKMQANNFTAEEQYQMRLDEIRSTAVQMRLTILEYNFLEAFQQPAAEPPKGQNAPDTGNQKRVAEHVLNNIRKEARLDYLVLTDAAGKVLFPTLPNRAVDISRDPMVKEVLNTKNVVNGTVKILTENLPCEKPEELAKVGLQQKPLPVVLAMETVVPLSKEKGQLSGMLIVGDVLNNDNAIVDKLKQMVFRENKDTFAAGSASIYLRAPDTEAVAIASSRGSEKTGRGIGAKLSQEVFDTVVVKGQRFLGQETIAGVNYVSAYTPIQDKSGYIVGVYAISVQETWFREFQIKIRNVILLVIAAALVFAVLLTYFVAGRLTKPIEEITESANKISLGDLDVSIMVHSGDEIEKLSESLERMRISLKSAIERLRKR